MKSIYKIGDVVKVAKFDDCIYGVNPDMYKLIGSYVHITEVQWRGDYAAFKYEIVEDNGRFWWSDQCFEREVCADLPEFSAAGSIELSNLFS